MATDPRYGATMSPTDMATEPKSKSSGCMKGCLIVFVILMVLAAIAAFVIWRNWRGWTANFASQVADQMIAASDFPAPEKAEMKAEVSRVVDAFRDGRLNNMQFATLMQSLVESPLMTTFVVTSVEQNKLPTSGLSDDEKTAGRQNLRRFRRGVIDGTIPKPSVDAVLVHVADRQPNNPWTPKPQVTDEQLKAFIDGAKAEADKANIPAEPADIDPSDELKKIIDQAMAAG
jgi:hypothetical protein